MAKVIENLDKKIVNLEGQEINDERGLPITVSKLLGNLIAQSKSKDSIRALLIAQQIYQAGKSVNLEDADYDMVLELINATDWSNLIKASVLEVFKPVNK